jgi:hypothetical protein
MEFHKLSQHTHQGVQFSTLYARQTGCQVSKSNKIKANKLSSTLYASPLTDILP